MPALTRRRDPDRPNCWHVYYGDVRVGTISRNPGIAAEQWHWRCGFYPGCHAGEQRAGTADTFPEARSGFEKDWAIFSAKRTEADYQEWRDHQDWAAWKYRMHDRGMPLPTQMTDGRARCFCGTEITTADTSEHIRIAHRGIGA